VCRGPQDSTWLGINQRVGSVTSGGVLGALHAVVGMVGLEKRSEAACVAVPMGWAVGGGMDHEDDHLVVAGLTPGGGGRAGGEFAVRTPAGCVRQSWL